MTLAAALCSPCGPPRGTAQLEDKLGISRSRWVPPERGGAGRNPRLGTGAGDVWA